MRDTIIVIGDVMLDKSYFGTVKRISPEAPIPIFKQEKLRELLGGAANVALNIKTLGENVSLFSSHNLDNSGKSIINLTKKEGITYFRSPFGDRQTTTKTRYWALNQQVSRVDEETLESITKFEFNYFKEVLLSNIPKAKLLVISDYEKGIITREIIEMVLELASKSELEVICDPKSENPEKYKGCHYLTPNYKELCDLVKKEFSENIFSTKEEFLFNSIKFLKKKYKISNPIVTLAGDGIAYIKKDELCIQPTVRVNVADPTGAGDSALAGLATAIARGFNIEEAVRWGVASSSNTVQEIGVSSCKLYKLKSSLISIPKVERCFIKNLADSSFGNSRKIAPIISDISELNKLINTFRKNGSSVLFTNGCFDLLHYGHIAILKYASSIADIVILGLNSDISISKIKGPSRPVNDFLSRSSIVTSLSYVDYVIPFDEETPFNIIKEIKPDILLKGGDYKEEEVVGKEFSSKVIIFKRIDGYSTTRLIQ